MAATALDSGERAPDFVALRVVAEGASHPTRFYALAGGRPALLLFCSSLDPEQAGEVAGLARALTPGASVHVITAASPESLGALPELAASGADVLCDQSGKVPATYRVADDAAPVGLLLDPNLRVLASGAGLDAGTWAREILDSRPPLDPVEVADVAPVLFVPHVLDEEFCRRLIGVWEAEGAVETGVERSAEGARGDALIPTAKRRRDHTVTDSQLLRTLTTTIGRRLMPELRKAFAYRATRFEGFKIACYDAERSGFFTAHRDNLSPATAHRRFALTLNLNEGYEGGHLRFPEYGPGLYRPQPGEALVFSCSHLHEVLPVTSGRRFVLLSFLFGE